MPQSLGDISLSPRVSFSSSISSLLEAAWPVRRLGLFLKAIPVQFCPPTVSCLRWYFLPRNFFFPSCFDEIPLFGQAQKLVCRADGIFRAVGNPVSLGLWIVLFVFLKVK